MFSESTSGAQARAQPTPIVGESVRIQEVRRLAAVAAKCVGDILITGDPGTGKAHVARAIHQLSCRPGPFFCVETSAPAALLDAELFGPRPPGTTLFLHDIAALPLPLQEQLRATRERETNDHGKASVLTTRLICGTSQDLPSLLGQHVFDEGLYERLAAFTIHLPTLNSHREDVPLLLAHFLGVLREETVHPIERFSAAAEEVLMRRSWKGNVRELCDYVRTTAELCSAKVIEPMDLWLPRTADEQSSEPWESGYRVLRKRVLLQFEADFVARVLKASSGNVSMAARLAKIDRKHLWRLIQRTGIRLERFGRTPAQPAPPAEAEDRATK
jgi:two-component system response regulator GlrR